MKRTSTIYIIEQQKNPAILKQFCMTICSFYVGTRFHLVLPLGNAYLMPTLLGLYTSSLNLVYLKCSL